MIIGRDTIFQLIDGREKRRLFYFCLYDLNDKTKKKKKDFIILVCDLYLAT